MLNKILLALGVVLAISALGSALKCNDCAYSTEMPKAQQKCSSGVTIDCPSGYCYTSSFTYPNGTAWVKRSCGASSVCSDAKIGCDILTKEGKMKSCAVACCTTDNCNNYTPSSATGAPSSATGAPSSATGAPSSATGAPSSATGVMVTDFTLSLMVIVGFIFA